jgi:hypothetical protein
MKETIEYKSSQNIEVKIGPHNRDQYLKNLMELEGLEGTHEDPKAAFCAIFLTSTPTELKGQISYEQQIIMDILGSAGITPYAPSTAPYSPDLGTTVYPNIVYRANLNKVASTRFFVANNVLPSTGLGVEWQTAKTFNRIPIILMNKNIRTSRMQPNRTICLEYKKLKSQAHNIANVFRLLQQYEPGMGFVRDEQGNKIPTLLGFDSMGKAVNLEQLVYEQFPQLQYKYVGTVSILQLEPDMSEIVGQFRSIATSDNKTP